MEIPSYLESLAEKLGGSASVKTIYGDPIETPGKTVFPVAKVAYGMGGGFGKATPHKKAGRQEEQPGGEGGGGGMLIVPVGVVEITQAHTRFIPIRRNKVVWAGTFLAGLLVGLLLGRVWRGRR
jgi:uncharacterized spore protein YtfJ